MNVMKSIWVKVMLAPAAIGVLAASSAVSSEVGNLPIADTLCYRVTSTGQTIDLTSMCKAQQTDAAIVVTNLNLEVAEEVFASSKVKATITNRSSQPVQVAVVRLQINRFDAAIATVPIFMNRTLNPGQSVLASGLFDKSELQGQDPTELNLSFQDWQ